METMRSKDRNFKKMRQLVKQILMGVAHWNMEILLSMCYQILEIPHLPQ